MTEEQPTTKTAILAFVASIKGLSRGDTADTQKLFTDFKSPNRPLTVAINNMVVTKSSNGFLSIKNNTIGYVNKVIREGDLQRVINLSSVSIPFTPSQEAEFITSVESFPERHYREIEDRVELLAKQMPELYVQEDQLTKLSSKTKEAIRKIEKKFMDGKTSGQTVQLTVGSVVVREDWMQEAIRERKGCFMFTTIDGALSSCKANTLSCIKSGSVNVCSTIPEDLYNVMLTIMHVATQEDTNTTKIELARIANIDVDKLEANLTQITDNDANFNRAYNLIANLAEKPQVPTCTIMNMNIEGGVVPACRMCSPAASPKSTKFIDPGQYAETISFQCVQNQTLLHLIADIEKTTNIHLIDIIDNDNNNKNPLKKHSSVVWILSVVIVLIVVIVAVFVGISQKSKDAATMYRVVSTA